MKLQVNYAGQDWINLKEWLVQQKSIKVQQLLQKDTDQREVENIRGSLQMIDLVLTQERRAALSQDD